MDTEQAPPTPASPEDWPEPTEEQVALIRRILAPRIRQARVERTEQQSAA
ncbi:hypothetical protein [Streptomyces buecherae]|uniref:Uncharacterized protein n=1 Tax=Streptomyces buecherae TaxID=2763006 RepID=A0A7H8NBA3_9ACTN|nr:hypothetical protein [Streptomyces buecherae]QKW51704.1 hypothetical protein HUT08_21695 [Streptomyces buecherae]